MSDQNERYAGLVRALQSGNRIPNGTIQRILTAVGRTSDDLLADAFGSADRAISGDPCPDCDGTLIVIDSRVVGDRRVRRLGCRGCGYREGRKLVTTQ